MVVSAGAGTGKTYNLVLRYLAALADGAAPPEIACVTFTRKAAAEMRNRIRSALLRRAASGPLARFAAQLQQDAVRYRRVLLSLSTAPIVTIDSLALRLVLEAEATGGLPEVAGSAARVSVASEAALSGEVESFVRERLAEERADDRSDLAILYEGLTPQHVRKGLVAALQAGLPDLPWPGADPQEVFGDWWYRLVQRPLDVALAEIRDWDSGELEQLLSESAADESALRPLRAVAGLAQGSLRPRDAWPLVDALLAVLLGPFKGQLRAWVKEHKARLSAAWGRQLDPGELDAAKDWRKKVRQPGGVQSLAKMTAAATRLVQRFGGELRRRLITSGSLRYQDVERLAWQVLHSSVAWKAMAPRFPLRHIFVDESQDTSQTQVSLLRKLAERTGARLFWVGDVKQSIYRFRGAEVDVFEGIADSNAAPLTVNRRSRPALIRSLNRLFGGLLPTHTNGVERDPRAAMGYEPLTWPQQRDGEAAEPCIEVIAEPGKHWELDEEVPPALEDALVRRVIEILRERRRRGEKPTADGFHVAVLVHAWSRAQHYESLFAQAGEHAVVQGGRGLLATPEVATLMLWLEAMVGQDDVALAGLLRGPGFGVSDDALYCLRRGFGVRATSDEAPIRPGPPPHRLSTAARFFELDPGQAVTDWSQGVSNLDEGRLRQTLDRDVAVLERFRASWRSTSDRLGVDRTADVLEDLLSSAGLWAWWRDRDGGRQRVANLVTFLNLLRELERDGLDLRRLLDHLHAIRDSDDPAAGGLEAGGEASILVTTYWQAKGREWPVVVLPDVQKTMVRSESVGFATERVKLPRPGGGHDMEQVPECTITKENQPFGSHAPLKALLDAARVPAERAELRRLLYVAMTRAKDRVVLSGRFDAFEADDKGTRHTLRSCGRWANTLMTCIDLRFDRAGRPTLGSGVWGPDDVVLFAPREVASTTPRASDLAAAKTGPLSLDPTSWAPIRAEQLIWISPSSCGALDPPDPIGTLPAAPSSWADGENPFGRGPLQGDAFHKMMERWGFGPGGRELDEALVIEVLKELALDGPTASSQPRATHLLALARRARDANPELWSSLGRAARSHHVFHEVELVYPRTQTEWVRGDIDLLWQDEAGWHILDYKSGQGPQSLADAALRKHYAQVRLYADGFAQVTGTPAVDFGLWYVATGQVIRWPGVPS